MRSRCGKAQGAHARRRPYTAYVLTRTAPMAAPRQSLQPRSDWDWRPGSGYRTSRVYEYVYVHVSIDVRRDISSPNDGGRRGRGGRSRGPRRATANPTARAEPPRPEGTRSRFSARALLLAGRVSSKMFIIRLAQIEDEILPTRTLSQLACALGPESVHALYTVCSLEIAVHHVAVLQTTHADARTRLCLHALDCT